MREYVWLDDLPLAMVADIDTATPKLYFVHADHLDRPVRMTDETKALVWDAVYRPFGEVQAITGSASNNLRFPGQYFLIEVGLHYNWHRHYDPTLGRYLQPDPLAFADGPSVYAYAGSSPTMDTDFEGLVRGMRPPRGITHSLNSREIIQGPFSVYRNVTRRGASEINIRTNVCRLDFEGNLLSQGYVQSLRNQSRLERGDQSYTFNQSNRGELSVLFNPGEFGPLIKIRLGD